MGSLLGQRKQFYKKNSQPQFSVLSVNKLRFRTLDPELHLSQVGTYLQKEMNEETMNMGLLIWIINRSVRGVYCTLIPGFTLIQLSEK
jgi:hypothetical protein